MFKEIQTMISLSSTTHILHISKVVKHLVEHLLYIKCPIYFPSPRQLSDSFISRCLFSESYGCHVLNVVYPSLPSTVNPLLPGEAYVDKRAGPSLFDQSSNYLWHINSYRSLPKCQWSSDIGYGQNLLIIFFLCLNSKIWRSAKSVHNHGSVNTGTDTHPYIYIYIYKMYMWQMSVFSHESAQRNDAGHLIDKNVFKTTRSFCYQWFRVSTLQANANRPFILSSMKRTTGGGHLENAFSRWPPLLYLSD